MGSNVTCLQTLAHTNLKGMDYAFPRFQTKQETEQVDKKVDVVDSREYG